jgi:hypothetical protein
LTACPLFFFTFVLKPKSYEPVKTLGQNWQNWVVAALAVTWLAAQNVGIGTTTPLTRLHVAEGDIFLGEAAGDNGFILHTRNWAGYDFFQISTRTGGSYEWSKGITLVRSSGNVGIGTTTPGAKLEVAGAIKVPAVGTLIFNDPNETGTPGGDGFRITYQHHFYGTYEDALIIEKTDFNDADPDGGISFVNTGSDGVAEPALTIRGNGRVGIGTTTPSHKLHIEGGNLRIRSAPNYNLITFNSPGWDPTAFVISARDNSLAANIPLSIDASRITLWGNVGIGTTIASI